MQQAATKRILLLMFTVMLLIAVAIATILPNRAVAKQAPYWR